MITFIKQCMFVLLAEIMLEMRDAQTQEGIRDERLRFLADFVLNIDARFGGLITQAGCLSARLGVTHTFKLRADEEEPDGEQLQLRVRSLVLGIKRLRLEHNGTFQLCAPSNTSLESCSSFPNLANVTCSLTERMPLARTLLLEGKCPDCGNDAEYELRLQARRIEIIVLVLKYVHCTVHII